MTASIDRRYFLGGALSMGAGLLLAPPLRAQSADPAPAASVARTTPRDAWQSWLETHNRDEGVTRVQNPADLWIYVYNEADVLEGPANQFMTRRRQAYDRAILAMKRDLSLQISTTIEGGQFFEVVRQNPEVAPPMVQEAARPLSTADRALELANRALDDQIRRFNPNWDGTGRTDEDRNRVLVREQERYINNFRTNAELFTSGAFPVCVFEGTSGRGQYVIGVGTFWSMRSQRVAQGIIDSAINIRGEPGISVRNHLNALIRENPNYLATAYGLQMIRDEQGDPVVLAYVSVDPSRSNLLNESLTRDLATRMIQTFIAEQATARSFGEERLTVQTLADDRVRSFDSSSYRTQIETAAPRMTISGLSVVRTWDGLHPSTRAPVFARVFAWSPDSRAAATAVRDMSDTQRRAVESTVGSPTAVRPNAGDAQGATSGGRQAVPTSRGQTTNPSAF